MKFKLLAVCLFLSLLVSSQNLNVKFRSQLKYPGQTLANICGYVDKTGKEYALVGASKGTSIVDISNPDSVVEIKLIKGAESSWREIKVKGDYAYVVSEGGGGVQIINLTSLPDTSGILNKNWYCDSSGLNTIHALHIDGHFVYLYGTNVKGARTIVADITDPYNPLRAGTFEYAPSPYIHDGYVRNDTLYGCHIYEGFCSVVDFRDKKNPKVLATTVTPGKYPHNTWLSQDSKILFTTDEVQNSFLTAYDISDLSNIQELDRIQSNPGSGSIVHNTHIIRVNNNDYAVTSWYRDGFTIVDAGRPSNLVQVGNYDTYAGSGTGFNGDWGVYPFFPSGTIVASDIQNGLFVCTPTYERACYLEGMVTDSATGLPINNATISIAGTAFTKKSKISGDYAIGMPPPGGVYTVEYSAAGYRSKTFASISFASAMVTTKNVQLVKSPEGISEHDLDQLTLRAYPNPFTNEITIVYSFQDKAPPATFIRLTDLLGRTVDQQEISQVKGIVALKPDVKAGIYFVYMVSGTASSAPVKLIKLDIP